MQCKGCPRTQWRVTYWVLGGAGWMLWRRECLALREPEVFDLGLSGWASQGLSSFPTRSALDEGPPQHKGCTLHSLCICLCHLSAAHPNHTTGGSLILSTLLAPWHVPETRITQVPSHLHTSLPTQACLGYIHKYAQVLLCGAVEETFLKYVCILLESWVIHTYIQ